MKKKDDEGKERDLKKIEIKAELEERPPLGPVVEEIHVIVPKRPRNERKQTLKFLEGLETAYAVRAKDGEVRFEVVKGDIRIYRTLDDGTEEMRYYRKGKERAIIFCDERELDNFRILGLIKSSVDV